MSLNSLGFGLGVENLEQQGKQVQNAVDVMNNAVEGGRVAHAMKNSPVMKPHTILKTKSKNKSPQWIVGKVFAEWCGHCITMKGEWENLKSVMKKEKGGAVEFIEIEDVEMVERLDELNKIYFQKGNKKVSSTGFPTVFMFQVANPGKTLDYFVPPGKERTMSDMKTWIKKNMGDSVSSVKSETKGGRRKTGKKKGVGNRTRRIRRKSS